MFERESPLSSEDNSDRRENQVEIEMRQVSDCQCKRGRRGGKEESPFCFHCFGGVGDGGNLSQIRCVPWARAGTAHVRYGNITVGTTIATWEKPRGGA